MDEEFPPARKVVTRAPARTVRVLNLGGILDGPVECESSLERDFVYRAALCPSVVLIKHQPFRLNWAAGKHYTPDFLVRHRDGQVTVVEVKLAEKAAAYRELFDRAAQQLAARSYAFMVLNERTIRHSNTHERATLILRYRKLQPRPGETDRVLEHLRHAPDGMPFQRLTRECTVSPEVLLHLIAMRRLTTSPGLPVGAKARVFMFDPGKDHHEIHLDRWFGAAAWRANAGAQAASR